MRFVLLILSLQVAVVATAQKHDNVWFFGRNVRLEFTADDSLPTPSVSSIQNFEPAGSFCDSTGQLQIVFAGVEIEYTYPNYFVFNRGRFLDSEGDPIPFPYPSPDSLIQLQNGDKALINDSISVTCSQSYFFLPNSKSTDTLHAILAVRYLKQNGIKAQQFSSLKFVKEQEVYRISGGFDRLTRFNTEYLERIACVKHADGRGWWLIFHEQNSRVYEIIHFHDGKVLSRNIHNIGIIDYSDFNNDLGSIPKPDFAVFA